MTDLRQALHALVEHPPAPPVAVHDVAARGERIARARRVRSALVGVALVAVGSAAALGLVRQSSDESAVMTTGGPSSAGYVAQHAGGYIASGTWSLTITRGGQRIELSSASSDHCGRTGLILPGDEVRGSIAGLGSTLRVGERFTCPE